MSEKPEISKEAIDATTAFNTPITDVADIDFTPGPIVHEPEKALTHVVNTLPALEPVTDVHSLSPIQQMQQAKAMGLSIPEMKEMMELQLQYEANEARKAFHLAMSEFKRNPPKIYKDMVNDQYGSDYVSIGNMVNGVNEAMGPFGLNARWDYPESNEPNEMIVTCILSHAMGHEEKVTIPGPVDMSGTKNPLQARKSTRSYLKLETFEAVTGTASMQGNLDDDGNAAGVQTAAPVVIKRITENEAKTIHAMITDNELRMDKFMTWLRGAFKSIGLQEIDDIQDVMYQRVVEKIEGYIQAKKERLESEADV